jgi:hypothetical protein
VRARFLDYARWRLSWRSWACCLPLHRQRRHPESVFYRGSMASPHVPLPKLACARLGADVVRYSIAVDLHHLLTQGRVERRSIDVLPARAAASRKTGRAFNTFAASRAFGKARKMANGKIASLRAGETAPEALLCANRGHWGNRDHASKQGRHSR